MSDLNIHWKGHPHHHLPRIYHVPSSRRASARSRSISQARPSLRNRKRDFFRVRRHIPLSRRTSRSSSATLQARKRVSLRARHKIQAFGWNTDLAGQENTERSTSTIRAGPGSNQFSIPQDTITGITITETTDGAGSWTTRIHKHHRKNYPRLKPVTEVPVYWTTSKQTQGGKKPLTSSNQNLSPVESCESCDGEPVGAKQTLDTIDPKSSTETRSKSKPAQARSVAATRHSTDKPVVAIKENKPPNLEDPAFWETLNTLASQVKESGFITPSIKSIIQSLSSDTVSRTPSQKEAIRKFTKEINLYLQTARANPKQSLTASPSATTISANTIVELKPFHAEFKAAGLAVTSAEQRRMPPNKPTTVQSPPTPPKDDKWVRRKSGEKARKPLHSNQDHSSASTSAESTVVSYTPYHENPYAQHQREKIAKHSSSEFAEIGTTPPREIYASPSRPAPSAPPATKTPQRKPLPWLQKTDQPIEEPIFVAGPSKALLKRTAAREKGKQKADPSPEIPQRPTGVTWTDTRYTREKTAADTSPQKRNQDSDIAARAEPKSALTAEPSDVVDDSNIAIQTLEGEEQSQAHGTESSNDVQGPLTSRRSETFPVAPTHCPDHFDPEPRKVGREATANKSSQGPLFLRYGVDRDTQSDDVDSDVPKKDASHAPHKKSSFKPATKPVERVQTPQPSQRSPPPRCNQCYSELSDAANKSIQQPRRPNTKTVPSHPVAELVASFEPKPSEDNSNYSTLEERYLRKILDYADQPPVADPTKRPSAPPFPLKPNRIPTSLPHQSPKPPVPHTTASHYHYYSCAPDKPIPQQPPVIIARPFPDPPSTATSVDYRTKDRHEVTNTLVFKGLHVATAAACDESIDKWIEEITGYGVRKLLADLSKFEGLGTNTLADVAKRASKQRRDLVRDWELVRESRMQGEPTSHNIQFVKEGGNDGAGDGRDRSEWQEYVDSFC